MKGLEDSCWLNVVTSSGGLFCGINQGAHKLKLALTADTYECKGKGSYTNHIGRYDMWFLNLNGQMLHFLVSFFFPIYISIS